MLNMQMQLRTFRIGMRYTDGKSKHHQKLNQLMKMMRQKLQKRHEKYPANDHRYVCGDCYLIV